MGPTSRTSPSRVEAGFERLGPPRRGDWRRVAPEPEQSFEQFVASAPARPTAPRSTLYLQPLGDIAPPSLELLRDYAEAFFAINVRLADAIPLAETAHVPQRDQYNSSMLIDALAGGLPSDAFAMIGITDRDLFTRGVRFVFGESVAQRRTGVCSLARLATPERELFRRRALRLLSHEAAHLFSIAHCATWRCVMQGSNTLEESDRHPVHLCPDDLRKLQWSVGVGIPERYRKLRTFYEKWGLTAEARWASDRLG